MKEIKVSPNSFALVDDDDFDFLNGFKWYLSNGYAIDKKRRKMHRIILKPKTSEMVDHTDHNKLNNQKSNIRIVNKCENVHNQIGERFLLPKR